MVVVLEDDLVIGVIGIAGHDRTDEAGPGPGPKLVSLKIEGHTPVTKRVFRLFSHL
ncbi:hypothetical protein [Sphaerisporangium album]|uniref:hypothetical protein n=1 Tax=Sphaerisporangium album TaxID=509200 RepID=UPI0015F0EF77|nr:hypothetical protein [Sphaerisporangium album]